jgi:hypothetical protein
MVNTDSMKTPRWICSKCTQPFTRRWNAYRHSNNKHFGSIENIISFTEYTCNRPDSSTLLNGFYTDNNSHHPLNVKNQLFYDKSISTNNLPFNSNTDPLENYMDQELSPYELLSPLAPKYEELRRILDHLPERSKNLLLGNALASAINSDNPVETMQKKVIEYRKSKSTVMMLNDLTKVYGGNKEFTKQLLKLKAKQKNTYH